MKIKKSDFEKMIYMKIRKSDLEMILNIIDDYEMHALDDMSEKWKDDVSGLYKRIQYMLKWGI